MGSLKRLRICYFSALFPPMSNSEALVSGRLPEWLKEGGHEVRVYSADKEPRYDGARISKLGHDLWALWRFNYKLLQRQTIELGQIYEMASYVNVALEASLTDHGRQPFDLIISRYWPTESAIAAYWANQRMHVPWISAINDPLPHWLEFPADRTLLKQLSGMVHRATVPLWHRRLLEMPDSLVFPCAPLMEWAMAKADSAGLDSHKLREKTSILPHMGMAAAAPVGTTRAGPPPGEKNVLRHLGHLYAKRDISTLLSALEMWEAEQPEALRVEFIGRIDPGQKKRLLEFGKLPRRRVEVTLREPVPQPEALALTKSASACLLVEFPGEESIYLPSKFCDYATARRPVLAVTAEKAPVKDYLTEFGGGVAVTHGDVQGTFRALQRVLRMSQDDCENLGSQFDHERVGAAWENLLSRVMATKTPPA